MSLEYQLAYQCLGPVFRFFCYRLRLIEQYKQETPLLFLSRGGLRLHHFYRLYLESNAFQPLAPRNDFYISRMAAFRALLAQKSRYAAEEIAREYGFQAIGTAMRYFLPEALFRQWQDGMRASNADLETPVSADLLLRMQSDSLPHASIFRDHTEHQHALLSEYFGSLCGWHGEAVLVDTGWSGSIIKSMQDLFPSTAITGAFFGRFNYGKPPPPWFDSITGLVIQLEHFSPFSPQSVFLFHRHLIESLCEPVWPSVTCYERSDEYVIPVTGLIPEKLRAPNENEEVAKAVADYIKAEPARSPELIVGEYHKALVKLARRLKYPSRREAYALGMPPRSADFGRELTVPVLLPRATGGLPIGRMRQSLWRQGQAAVEFGAFAFPIQLAVTWKNVPRQVFARLRRILRDSFSLPKPGAH